MRRRSTTLLLAATLLAGAALASAAEPAAPYDPKAAFAETDRNGDGVVDLEEFHQRIVDVYYAADADKNGTLSAAELSQLPHPEAIKDVDRDGDGKVTLHEFVRVRFLQFQDADANHDGELSLEEVIRVYQVK